MRKYLLFTQLFLFVIQADIHSQNVGNMYRENYISDSLKIETLKQRLHDLKDTARINCLNELGTTFGNSYKTRDSAFFYSDLANREALQKTYKYGETQALINLAKLKYRFLYDTTECKKYIKRALTLAIELNDDLLIGKSYLQLGYLENTAENFQKSIYYFKKKGSIKLETEATIRLCMEEMERGRYEASFTHCKNCVELARTNVEKDPTDSWAYEMVSWSYYNMYDLYKAAGDNETALEYAMKAKKWAEDKNVQGWFPYDMLNDIYISMGKLDSALIYWNLMKKDYNTTIERGRIVSDNRLAQIYLKKNQPDSALSILENSLKKSISLYKKMTNKWDEWPLLNTLFLQGEAYLQKKDYKRALQKSSKAMEGFERNNSRERMMDGYQLLSSIYYHLGKHKDAYETFVKYQAIKDSIQSRQFLIRLNSYKSEAEDAKKESRIGYLQRDNQIKQQQLKQEAQLKKFLLISLVLMFLSGVFIFRTLLFKRKNEKLAGEKTKAELQQKVSELEMQALRAQMNPHFIFNCLSSINRFIFKNDNKTASDYLTRFSRLIRMVLMNSSRKLITLEDELEMLRLYLDLERLRFKNAFDFSITTTNIVDAGTIFIPPLLLQPFCENAVWHGLMHKDSKGHLNVIISEVINENDKSLYCLIEDDGVGRERAAELKSKSAESEKSLGLKITTERLALMNKENIFSTFYKIEDISNENNEVAGTRVQLKIKYKETVEEII